jgi:hypothetical protein
MKVVTTNNDSALHFVLDNNATQNATANGNVGGERALLVDVSTFNGLKNIS